MTDADPTATDNDAPADVTISIQPQSAVVAPSGERTFTCVVVGASDTSCQWSVQEANGGAIDDGDYTAPNAPGTFHIRVVSVADPTKSATATITVPTQATGTPGVWENVTPGSVNLDPNSNPAGNFGTTGIVADPARPSDLYFAVCYQGLWKSTNYGLSWTHVNTGTNGDKVEAGRPMIALGSDPGRDPATPPKLYSNSLYGALGMWRSVDGGVSWTDIWHDIRSPAGANISSAVWMDVMGPTADPHDGDHLIVGMHGNTQGGAYDDHVFESFNAGDSWVDRGPTGNSTSLLLGFVNSTTWIAQGDLFGGGNTQRTTNSGSTWEDVGDMCHPHGGSGYVDVGGGRLYLAAMNGLYTSQNYGADWTKIPNTPNTSVVAATPTTIYSSYGWATTGGGDPQIGRTNRATGSYTAMAWPSGMSSGGIAWTSTTDGDRWIIVGANWNAGIWRFVEP